MNFSFKNVNFNLVFIAVANILDLVFTMYLVSMFGTEVEANPIARALFDWQWWAMPAFKIAAIVFVCWSLWEFNKQNPKVALWASWGLCGLMGALLIWWTIILCALMLV